MMVGGCADCISSTSFAGCSRSDGGQGPVASSDKHRAARTGSRKADRGKRTHPEYRQVSFYVQCQSCILLFFKYLQRNIVTLTPSVLKMSFGTEWPRSLNLTNN